MTSIERCPVCGAALRDDSSFCVSCGMPRPVATPAASAAAPAVEAPEPAPATEPGADEATSAPEPVAVATAEPVVATAPAPEAVAPESTAPAAPAPTPAPAAHTPAAPEFKLTAGRAAIGPLVLVIALALLVAAAIWIHNGYPLPAGW